VSIDAPAPEDASAVRLQLLLWDAPNGTLLWDDISLTPIPAPESRPVRVASINLRPNRTGSAAASVSRFIETVDKTVTSKVDIILLPEGITIIGTGKKYADVAEPVPGPTTRALAELARRHHAYVAAGIYEREGPAIYNTAILLDRSGKVAGKYRKVYIPREETEGGIKPGSHYPVFETDFGKVGMMICWDVHYTDPARALALAGAELILMPIWGGNETLAKARAIENHLFLAASGYDYPTHILDPNGETLAIASQDATAAITTIHLDKRYVDQWLGNMRARFFKEPRLDIDTPWRSPTNAPPGTHDMPGLLLTTVHSGGIAPLRTGPPPRRVHVLCPPRRLPDRVVRSASTSRALFRHTQLPGGRSPSESTNRKAG
ncbi:MAG: carbon-nitrogen hydrolase family protein, partial [bacterium]|nr:carbon-nitrogen hydrolase family protein [bacterium]